MKDIKKNIVFVISVYIFTSFLNVNAETITNHIKKLAKTDVASLQNDDPDKNIRYVGSNPDNYVLFNNELWRIIGIFDGRVKLIRKDPIGKYSWDSSDYTINSGQGINEWSQSKLMQELNGDYLDTTLTANTYWYNGRYNVKTQQFDYTKVLNSESQSLIDDAVWYLGAADSSSAAPWDFNYQDSSLIASVIYRNERGKNEVNLCANSDSIYCTDNVSRTSKWTGKVGLMYLSDYVYSASGGNTTDRQTCLSTAPHSWISTSDCVKTSWLKNNSLYTINPASSTKRGDVLSCRNSNGQWTLCYAFTSSYSTTPTVYLKSNILLKSGNGTERNPYTLENANTITFDTDGGSLIENQYIEDNKLALNPPTPTKEDSTFMGWYTDETFNNQYNFDTPVTDDTKLYAKWKFNYKILSGAQQTVKNTTSKDVVIRSNGKLSDLVCIKINGEILDPSNYTLESGSTILKLNSPYLNTLSSDTYDISFVYNDGDVGTTLTVSKEPVRKNTSNNVVTKKLEYKNPKTGDNIILSIALFMFSIIGLLGLGLIIRRKRN